MQQHRADTTRVRTGHIEVCAAYKQPASPVWVVCSESHYSVLFCKNGGGAQPAGDPAAAIDGYELHYYDELVRSHTAPFAGRLRSKGHQSERELDRLEIRGSRFRLRLS